jgi:hypothetical protein
VNVLRRAAWNIGWTVLTVRGLLLGLEDAVGIWVERRTRER